MLAIAMTCWIASAEGSTAILGSVGYSWVIVEGSCHGKEESEIDISEEMCLMLFGPVVLFEEEAGLEPCAFGPMTFGRIRKKKRKESGRSARASLHAP
jgi:hypothetical protein